jgi:2-keto-3-deoxy-6-phosphogluconate aldolase
MRTRIPLPNNWRHHQIVAVLRAPVQEFLLPVALELHDLGVRAIEIALTSPGALAIIEELASRIGHEGKLVPALCSRRSR